MEKKDLKVGMKVKAIDNFYGVTNKGRNWIGKVVGFNYDNTRFIAETIKVDGLNSIKTFRGLDSAHFAAYDEQKEELAKARTILRVTERDGKIKVYYKDKLIAEARCSEDDTYDEEFGLNLALRRACKTLNNQHEIIIKHTENVEDFL